PAVEGHPGDTGGARDPLQGGRGEPILGEHVTSGVDDVRRDVAHAGATARKRNDRPPRLTRGSASPADCNRPGRPSGSIGRRMSPMWIVLNSHPVPMLSVPANIPPGRRT